MGHIQNGSMAAVIGITAENLQDILNQQNQSHLTIANYNSYLQNIISGTSDAIRNTTELLQKDINYRDSIKSERRIFILI